MDKLKDIKSGLKYVTQTFRSSLEILICIHAVLQKLLRRKKGIAKVTVYPLGETTLNIVIVILSLLVYVILFSILINFMIYRYYVHLRLKRIHRSNYVGLLKGSDAIWAVEDNSRGLINGLMVIEYNKDSDTFYETMKSHVTNTLLKYTKFKCVRRQYMGYMYFLKNQLCDDDVIKRMDVLEGVEELDKNSLCQLLTRYCNAPLPKQDTATCEIVIGTQKVRWRANDGGKCNAQYPVLYRLHHSIGDGMSLQNIILRKLVDDNEGIVIDKFLRSSQNKKRWIPSQTNSLDKIVHKIKIIVESWYKQIHKILSLRTYRLSYLTRPDKNIIHGPKLSGEKHFVCSVEDKAHYVPMVKDIKNKLHGAGFSDIVLTAVARSFGEYFREKSSDVPRSISVALTVLPPNEDIRVVTSEHINLCNRFSLGYLPLPMDPLDETVTNTLKKVKENINSLRNSIDVTLNYWQIKIMFGLLPASVVRGLVDKGDSTMGLSSVPGTGALTILGGHRIHDFIFWIPNKSRVGVGMSIYTYDNRFQLAMLVDKSVMENKEDVQNILSNVFKYIHALHQETKNCD